MTRIFITGDRHRRYEDIISFCELFNDTLTKNDLMIVLGDNGINFCSKSSDDRLKSSLEQLPISFMFLRGNHDIRPSDIPTYQLKWINTNAVSGKFYVEEKYPSLLFATDTFYTIKTNISTYNAFCINGAYSVDKYFRLQNGFTWVDNEQLSEEEMNAIEKDLSGHKLDFVLSHTCPFKYRPTEMFISGVDQSMVDNTMEHWMDRIESIVEYERWYCGHWHTNKTIDNLVFLYDRIEEIV